MEKVYYSYDSIHNIINNKAAILKEYDPDIIVAIGGGGLIPARIIRSYIDKPVLVVTISSYDDENMKDELSIVQWINNNFENKRILLVDEIDDTGRTLAFCVNKLKEVNKANNICVFVIHNKQKTKDVNYNEIKELTYFSGENIDDKWIVYPWEINERV